MRIDRRLLNWGLFFVLLGAVPLAVRQGFVAEASLDRWWTLWPLFLIGAGLGLLLRRTPLAFVGGLLSAATIGVMGGALLATGFQGFDAPFVCGDERGAVAFAEQRGTFDGARVSVTVAMNCGDVVVDSAAGTGWQLTGADDDGRGPAIDASGNSLVIRSRDQDGPLSALGKRDRWDITLPTDPVLDVDLSVNAGSATATLDGTTLGTVTGSVNAGSMVVAAAQVAGLERLDIEVNAGSAAVDLPARSVRGSLSVNAGSIEVCTPPDAGVRFVMEDNFAAGNNFAESGLTQRGDAWESTNLASAAVRLEFDVDANAGSVTLNPEDGCDG